MCEVIVCKFVCVKFVCVKLLYVKAAGGGGGREEAGIQNQKQEPHTKMWGITSTKIAKIC